MCGGGRCPEAIGTFSEAFYHSVVQCVAGLSLRSVLHMYVGHRDHERERESGTESERRKPQSDREWTRFAPTTGSGLISFWRTVDAPTSRQGTRGWRGSNQELRQGTCRLLWRRARVRGDRGRVGAGRASIDKAGQLQWRFVPRTNNGVVLAIDRCCSAKHQQHTDNHPVFFAKHCVFHPSHRCRAPVPFCIVVFL